MTDLCNETAADALTAQDDELERRPWAYDEADPRFEEQPS